MYVLFQDNNGMLSLLGTIEQCLKAGKKQQWHAVSVTNICVALLAGLKVLIFLHNQQDYGGLLFSVSGVARPSSSVFRDQKGIGLNLFCL